MKKRQRTMPEVSTASLPDIIFMLLFFFMVVTVLRKDKASIQYDLPNTENSNKVDQNKEFAYLYIGKKAQNQPEILIQLNDHFVNENNIDLAFEKLLNDPTIDRSTFEVSMKADRSTPMKLIRKVKKAMQKAGIRHLYYLSENKKIN